MPLAFSLFLRSAFESPLTVGAITPSSRYLAQAMVKRMDGESFDEYIDLGAGTGVFTKALLDAGISPERITLVESQSLLHANLTVKFPECKVVLGGAEDYLNAINSRDGLSRFITSGLPLRLFGPKQKKRFQDAVTTAVGSNGKLMQFTYGFSDPLGQIKTLPGIRKAFVLRNFPPAWVWSYSPVCFEFKALE